jgi:hypothetical protein
MGDQSPTRQRIRLHKNGGFYVEYSALNTRLTDDGLDIAETVERLY